MVSDAGPSTFIKLDRKLLKWGWYTDGNTLRVFLHLLLNANYTAGEFKGYTLKPGDLPVGRKALAVALGLSEQQIRTSLSKLKKTKEITIKATNKFTIITLINWELYQSTHVEATNKSTSNQPTSNQQVTTLKERKKGIRKEYKNGYDYSSWPNKPDEQTLKDWFKLRKEKKASVSQTVINSFGKEFVIADNDGVNVDQCLSLCIQKGWIGFKYEWYKNELGNNSSENSRRNTKL